MKATCELKPCSLSIETFSSNLSSNSFQVTLSIDVLKKISFSSLD